MLSRMAALQGHAVPVYRFGTTVQTAEGLALNSLPRNVQAMELWQAHFPAGQVSAITQVKNLKGLFPLLWLSQDQSRILMLRGQLSSGACSAEDPQGQTLELTRAEQEKGYTLELKTSPEQDASGQAGPATAGEWFAYALGRYRGAFSQAVFATFIISTIGLLAAMYTMQVYDRVVPSKGYSTLFVLTVGVLISILMELLIKQVRANMVERACKAIDQELSSVFFGKALDIRMDARPRTVGTFASQIRHFESVRNFLTLSLIHI